MADDAPFRTDFFQHWYADFTGERAVVFKVAVFRRNDQALRRIDAVLQRCERSRDAVICAVVQLRFNFIDEADRFRAGLIHFPVSDNNWFSH